MVAETDITTSYSAFRDTSIYERYMLNYAQFSAAKNVSEVKLIQAQLFNEDKVIRSFSDFSKEAKKVTTVVQQDWFRIEYESQRRGCVMGSQYRRMMEDADLYPYWVWKGVMDHRERKSHVAMEDKVFKIGDPAGDKCYPPADWNCRCNGDSEDDDYINDNGLKVLSNAEAEFYMNKNVDEQFQFNPGVQGMLPKKGSYFDLLESGNEANWNMFGLKNATELTGKEITTLAIGLHNLLEIMESWKDKDHVNKAGEIVFQNKQLLTNIRFTARSLHDIQQHSRGFETLPDAIKGPDEVWSTWEDTDKQMVVLRNYIKFGPTPYIVQTRDGVITDAFVVSKAGSNKYRKGVFINKQS